MVRDHSELLLLGKVALVTGGARGLGRAYALRLAALGADVVVCDIDLAAAEVFGEKLNADGVPAEIALTGRRSLGVSCDVSKTADVRELIQRVEDGFGRLDILVCNAGGVVTRDGGSLLPSQTDMADYDRLLDVNLRGTVLCCQAAAPIMKRQRSGVIVNISSQAGLSARHDGGIGIYGAAKAAVAMYTRNLAAELGSFGIRVNAIAPGLILTSRVALEAPKRGIGTVEQAAAIPLRRFGTTKDCANVLEFLTTDLSQYVTGQVISVCGGAVLSPH